MKKSVGGIKRNRKEAPIIVDFDFLDGNYTGWIVLNGSWSASGNALLKTDNGWGNVAVLSDDADNEIRFDYRFTDISGADMGQVVPRFLSGDDNLAILIAPGAIILYSTVSGTAATLDYQTFSTTQDQWYTLRIVCDGSDVTVWRSTEGELETEVLSTSSAAPTTTDAVLMGIVNDTMSDSPFEFDNIRILADDLDNTTTFTVNNANQVTAMDDFNGTTNFAYDPWGRMTKKNVSTTYTANYYYNYGSKMTKSASNFPDEGSVTYNYGGDQKRRQRTVGGVNTWYNWSAGWTILNEESGTGSGTLQKTYIGRMAEVAGSNPAIGTYSYYATDNLGSPRAVYSQAKTLVADLDYTPYGQAYTAHDTIGITHRYTGHDWDATAALYFAPFRFYNPRVARWMSRDPLGMADGPNTYGYVRSTPVFRSDRTGKLSTYPGQMDDAEAGYRGLLTLLGIPCAWRIGSAALNAPGQGGSNADHCRVACEIQQQCGGDTGFLAAIAVEWIEFPWPWEWDQHSDEEIRAGEEGAAIGQDCGADCAAECNQKYP